MDLFKQLRAFYDQLDLNPLSSSEIALWHALTFYNNKLQASEFTIAASVLCAKSGLKERNFFKARNALTQSGLITWKSRNGNQSAVYHMRALYEPLPAYSADSSTDSRSYSSADSSTDSRSPLTTITKTKTVTKKSKSPKRKKRVYADDSVELTLADKLFKRIKENNPETREPNLQNWADDIRLMIERDNRKANKIENMIDRCQEDSFWSGVILSAKKLREKYDTMAAQFNRPAKQAKTQKSVGVMPKWLKDQQAGQHLKPAELSDEQKAQNKRVAEKLAALKKSTAEI
ncbi:hypothetical protein [Lapidilactobacillus bayanensis]|uniref:hypothetical protein n=1 Tax=Lapidilactobacillus bayanensis TaxID=2485998 RepID=UPI000F7A3195|nr:hypothetical protein [Lapidilactobacillus bayanensis]